MHLAEYRGKILIKKKIIITGIIIIAIVISAIVYFSQPENIVNDISKYSIYRVVYNGEDVTEQVDRKALSAIVSKYRCSRLPYCFAPYQQSQVVVELNGVNQNAFLHIILGDINVAYESANKGGLKIQNSRELLKEILNRMPNQTEEDLGLKAKKITTFPDGESADLWRPDYSGSDVYKLSDGTTLLYVQDPTGPERAYVAGVESYDDLSDSAQKAVSAYYKGQGLLYDTQTELENAYNEYISCKKSGTAYHAQCVSQDIAPTASNDTIMCFLTSVTLPVKNQESKEIHLGAAFDRTTGKVLSNWDLFNIPEEAARKWLIDAFNIPDSTLKAEMQAALKPEYIILFPDNLEVSFPPGTLPDQEHRCDVALDYNKLGAVFQPWAIPKSSVKK